MQDIRSKMEQAKNEIAEAETQPAVIKQEAKFTTPQKEADVLGRILCWYFAKEWPI